ncbi:MAG: hypothetical protein JWM09_175 [Francisellaceae bacterium]|nr:hypothetical protein [Francisellaceae bacterium]
MFANNADELFNLISYPSGNTINLSMFEKWINTNFNINKLMQIFDSKFSGPSLFAIIIEQNCIPALDMIIKKYI